MTGYLEEYGSGVFVYGLGVMQITTGGGGSPYTQASPRILPLISATIVSIPCRVVLNPNLVQVTSHPNGQEGKPWETHQ